MTGLYEDKKNRSLYFFSLITAIPVIGTIIIFSLAYMHIKNDINFVSHELKGLNVITHIQATTLNIQRLRGLVCIDTPNSHSLEKTTLVKSHILQDINTLLVLINNTKENTLLKQDLLNFINFIKNSHLESFSYEEFTQTIDKLINFSSQISYHCNLILEPNLDKFVLVNNLIFLLPELLENNGQIRATMVSAKNGILTPVQREKLIILKHKIQDILNKLEFNQFLLKDISKNDEIINQTYKNMKEAEQKIIDFTTNAILDLDNEKFEPNGIFIKLTNNIDMIVNMYNYNLAILDNSLNQKLKDYRNYQFYAVFFTIIAILFILTINRMFYLKNRKYIDKIEELTITDAMTTLYNRRYFDGFFENCLRIQQRTKQSISFIIFDIDFFKQYNDTYGHQAGDNAIKTIAITIKESLRRASDKAFRLGGEEFGILCIAMDENELITFADSIRKKIEYLKIEHKSSSVSKYMTISMGIIAVKEGEINSTSQIYKFADEALYKAKESGRNKVIEYHIKKKN